MMEKLDVNGPDAHLVYLWLKDRAGVETITWNFATYFLVGPDGNVESYSGVEPTDLESTIRHLLKQADEDEL